MGSAGLRALENVRASIPAHIPVIMDAKRGDIDSSSRHYAKAIFEIWGADAVTVSPYMGLDSLDPFLAYAGRGVFILGLTSNPGRHDVELLKLADGRHVFEAVMDCFGVKNYPATRGWVIGATLGELTRKAMALSGSDPVLVPGIGAQGGDLKTVFAHAGKKNLAHIIINASRSILYAEGAAGFEEGARRAAGELLAEIQNVVKG
jgi:orotidine-5'-phosphate decarboxylase